MGVTSVMLEDVCGPAHMHEYGGNTHGNIYGSDSYEVNIDEDGGDVEVFTQAANDVDLNLRYDENSNGSGERSDDDAENNTNYSKMMKSNLTPLGLRTFFQMIVIIN